MEKIGNTGRKQGHGTHVGHTAWLGADINRVVREVCLVYSYTEGIFLLYGRPLINATHLPLSMLNQIAIKETSEAASLTTC